MENRLAGSGPAMPGATNAPGPVQTMQDQQGAIPQAAPNMLAGGQSVGAPGGMPGAQQQPAAPPSTQQLIEVAHKTGYINSMLSELVGKPDVSARDVLDGVGHLVAEQVMDPFMAAKYLGDLPTDSTKVRQWVAGHYAASMQSMRAVANIIHARGVVQRAQAAQAPAMAQPQQVAPAQMAQPMPDGGQ